MSSGTKFYSNENVRPYEGLEEIENALSDMEIFLRSRNAWLTSEEITFRDDDVNKPQFKARLDLTNASTIVGIKAGIKKAGFSEEEVIFGGIVRCKTTKGIRHFFSEKLSAVLNKGGIFEIAIPLNEFPVISKESSLQLEFYLITDVSKPQNFPRPRAKATWLAQKQFILKSQQHGKSSFKIEDLTDEIRKARNLGKNSTMFVDNIYPLHEMSSLFESVTVYLDKDLRNLLSNSKSKKIKDFIWADIWSKTLTSALQYSLPLIKNSNKSFKELEHGTAFGSIIRTLANAGTRSTQNLDPDDVFYELLAKSELAVEYVEDRAKLLRHALQLTDDTL